MKDGDTRRHASSDAGVPAREQTDRERRLNALRELAHAAMSTSSATQPSASPVASHTYRPDGKVVAAILPGAVAQGTAKKRITLFSTANGAQIGVVSALTRADASLESDGTPEFAWSPTGAQLGYFDYFTSSITLWGGSSLPA